MLCACVFPSTFLIIWELERCSLKDFFLDISGLEPVTSRIWTWASPNRRFCVAVINSFRKAKMMAKVNSENYLISLISVNASYLLVYCLCTNIALAERSNIVSFSEIYMSSKMFYGLVVWWRRKTLFVEHFLTYVIELFQNIAPQNLLVKQCFAKWPNDQTLFVKQNVLRFGRVAKYCLLKIVWVCF